MLPEHPSFNSKTSTQDDSLNIREEVEKYIAHWKWFVVSAAVCLFAAAVYLRYSVPMYKSSATILVKDDRKGGLQSELTALSDLGLTSGVKNVLDNEIEVIQSRSIIEKAILKNFANVEYFTEGRVKSLELYKDKPIDVYFFGISPKFYSKARTFTVKSVSQNTFELFAPGGKSFGKFHYGRAVAFDSFSIVVTPNPKIKDKTDLEYEIIVQVRKLAHEVQRYKGSLEIVAKNKNSSVVELTLTDRIRERSEDMLDAIIETYNEDAIADKKYISENTEKFIAERLDSIAVQLGDVERDAASFKQTNRLTDIVSDAGIYLQNSVIFEKELIETETQLRVVQSMIDYLETAAPTDPIPINLIPNDMPSANMITEYNADLVELARMKKSATNKNYVIESTQKKVDEKREVVKQNLKRLLTSLAIRKSDLEKQVNMVSGKISRIPSQERQFRVIDRQQKIKEALFTYLLQKREEIAISLAVTPPNAKVVDVALAADSPVAPKRNMIYLLGLVIGLAIPFLFIYLSNLLDSKVKTRSDIEGKITAPFLGDIPKSDTENEIINASSRSSSAEAIRIVRTNLEFMLSKVPHGRAKTIAVTSTMPKEGKTFVAINLSGTIALSGKKVLLIGLDIRNPKIDKYVKLPSKGLTNYLVKSDDDISNYIVPLEGYDHFHVLPSGVVPPNPVDLLMNDKLGPLFEELRSRYDYIVVDTAPVSLVTDTLLITQFMDAFVYVLRANYFDKRMMRIVQSFYAEGKLPNMAVLLNDTMWTKTYGYGYGYGYGYEQDAPKKPWWKKFGNGN